MENATDEMIIQSNDNNHVYINEKIKLLLPKKGHDSRRIKRKNFNRPNKETTIKMNTTLEEQSL